MHKAAEAHYVYPAHTSVDSVYSTESAPPAYNTLVAFKIAPVGCNFFDRLAHIIRYQSDCVGKILL